MRQALAVLKKIPEYQQIRRSIAKSAGRILVNELSEEGMAALVLSVAAGAALALFPTHPAALWAGAVALLLRMALNAMDGMLAREHRLVTPLGGALNETGDVLADLALYLPLALFRPEAAIPIVAFNFASVLTEFCGLLGPSLGVERRYDGPMGKSDRAFGVGLLCLLAPLSPATLASWPWIFTAAGALALLTCFNRVRGALKQVKGKADA